MKKNNKTIKKESSTNSHQYISHLVSRTLMAVIFLLVSIIYVNYSTKNKMLYQKYMFTKNMSFASFNKWYKNLFGNFLPMDKAVQEETKFVFNETFTFSNQNKFYDGAKFVVTNNYLMPAISSGIIVFIGEKENYGNVIIVQGTDGVDIWYGNITNSSLKLYDYVETGSLIGQSIKESIILVIQKNGAYLNYYDYIKKG